MNKESFNHLLELQSCEKKIKNLQLKIEEENNRITFVEKNIDRTLNEIQEKNTLLTELKKEIISAESLNAEIILKIERTEKNASSATSQTQVQASEREISVLKPKQEESESLIMDLWEKSELLESEIKESKNFESGSNESLRVLKTEVAEINSDTQSKILTIENRKKELFALLDDNTSKVFKQLESQKSPAVTFMDQKRCTSCMTQLDQSLIAEVNAMRSLAFCTTCGRILTSLDVRY